MYCRLSYAEDGTEEKVDRQESDCRQLAERLAWPISELHVFKDNNRSAWQRNRKRPGWDALLAAIKADEIDSVIIWHGDRLIRQPYDLEQLINIADSKGVRLASIAGTRDLDNSDDRYILRIEAAGFCRSSDDTSRRVKRGLQARAERGLPRTGGTRAFGFERDNITPRPSETEVIAEGGQRLLAGQSNYSVIRWANTVSTTTEGNPWTPLTFPHMITRPRIAGLIERNGDLYEAVWDPIIEVEEWHLIRGILKDRKNSTPVQDHGIRYLLSWIARCGTCTGPLVTRNQGGKKQRRAKVYGCTNPHCAKKVSCAGAHLDAYVSGRVVRVLNDRDFIKRLVATQSDPRLADEIVALERRRAEAKAQLENLADYPEIDVGMIARSLGSFDTKIERLRGQQQATARQRRLTRMAGVTREQWDNEPLDVRRSTVKDLFDVTVLPALRKGPGFDPARVKVRLIEESD